MHQQLATTADRLVTPFGAPIWKAALFGALIGTAVVLGMEMRDLTDRHGGLHASMRKVITQAVQLSPETENAAAGHPLWQKPIRKSVQRARPADAKPALSLTLNGSGELALDGYILPGSANRLRDMLETSTSPIIRVSLNSPGGSLNDAMAMASLIRQRRLSTIVEADAVCGSSCPLVLAGGIERQVERGATVAVHQFYSPGSLSDPRQALSDAQLVTARIARHLDKMGVDPALWLHALDTPPRALYRLSEGELGAYRLATVVN
ncbi:hypothetical protein ACFPOD_15750 [Nitratireductor kimnyeongensis]|uniref:Uncharacterized protein n=1 Tax=Nitratireductor kimnyeongensis TaxID=430679 RepID=A0ABW0TCH3_9HYPH|nr:hypothetical protein [Nitratireductor kimnyeongensis]QZZ36847.1 hypothetical protein KW403_06890 [Nitratireductor kimnyeongensis]